MGYNIVQNNLQKQGKKKSKDETV